MTREWCDDFLHSVFAVVRPGEQVCHRPYQQTDLHQTLHCGFVYEGSLREQPRRRAPTERVDTQALIYSIQHHDFIGNHPLGKRLHQLTSRETQRAAAALLLLSPAIPMLFMGEEFACEHPFRFFVDFGDEQLRRAVADGRQAEYPQHDWSSGQLPTDPATFHDSKIGAAAEGDQQTLDWYRALIRQRKIWTESGLICDANFSAETDIESGLYVIRYTDDQQSVVIAVRITAPTQDELPIPFEPPGDLILDSRPGSLGGRLMPNHAKVFCFHLTAHLCR